MKRDFLITEELCFIKKENLVFSMQISNCISYNKNIFKVYIKYTLHPYFYL